MGGIFQNYLIFWLFATVEILDYQCGPYIKYLLHNQSGPIIGGFEINPVQQTGPKLLAMLEIVRYLKKHYLK